MLIEGFPSRFYETLSSSSRPAESELGVGQGGGALVECYLYSEGGEDGASGI